MRRWFARTKLLLESEQIQLTTNTLDDMTLNSYRILTTQDLGGIVGPPGPPGPPGIPTSLAAIGNTPNANGASLSGSTLNLQPANASFGGVVTTGTQTLAGQKTLSGKTLLAGTKDNVPFGISNERVLVINGNTGELSCNPFYSDSGNMTLNIGSITTATPSNPPVSDFYGIFAANMVHMTVQPNGFVNNLVTANTGSPTVCDLTGSLTLPFEICPPGDTTFIGPFVNNGVFTSSKWTVTTLGKIIVELIPSAAFVAPFGLGTNSFTLSYTTTKD